MKTGRIDNPTKVVHYNFNLDEIRDARSMTEFYDAATKGEDWHKTAYYNWYMSDEMNQLLREILLENNLKDKKSRRKYSKKWIEGAVNFEWAMYSPISDGKVEAWMLEYRE